METRASYLLVGSFVLALLVGALGFVIWLANFQVQSDLRSYELVFKNSVTGLSEASPVRYAGVRVGEVRSVRLDPDHPEQVQVIVEVQADTPVKQDTVASMEFEGLAGGRYILLQGGSKEAAAPKVEPGRRYPRIRTRPSTISQVIEGAPDTLAAAQRVLNQVEKLVDDENLQTFSNTLKNLETVTGAVATRSADIDKLLKDASGTMENISQSTSQLAELATELRGDANTITASTNRTLVAIEGLANNLNGAVGTNAGELQRTLVEVRKAAGSIKSLSDQVNGMVAENREPLHDFTATGLYELAGLLNQMKTLVSRLNNVTAQVERDPARFLFGDSQEGYETQPTQR
ncbi:phospholipid/cholesterol/gamma-HCH transport system substrate-binding protein [Tistlia consotensis]|uniref:Phospholipid/cholesterol/gamma-HCH transport system substrate-binding protein n=1 Tax=Tistlia consotensis USBA 355 TaxID=560819 RepID=A0A1Y6C347_9PROT|nr:MlaD family protein [Tistlia consotensis]SMF39250.1 phospholipid/cholesterol/gamma-HCH transport system substrate-binding protein [Tistlia consotensis USBA 355]SNR36488.1 phospholipid/cholesterol/gamma-HCH transport system substrate-binding protein [Tistlia consotensis]